MVVIRSDCIDILLNIKKHATEWWENLLPQLLLTVSCRGIIKKVLEVGLKISIGFEKSGQDWCVIYGEWKKNRHQFSLEKVLWSLHDNTISESWLATKPMNKKTKQKSIGKSKQKNGYIQQTRMKNQDTICILKIVVKWFTKT